MKLLNKMRNTGIALLGGFALLTYSAALTGCSDNDEQGLYASDSSNIGIVVEAKEAAGYHNGILELGSAQSTTPFSVISTTRWTVEITNCEGSWCQIVYGEGNSDAAGHIGDGSFTVEAAPNRSGNSRECTVTVYAIESDGTHIPGKSVVINVEQDRQSIQVDYAGDVISPLGTTQATMPTVTVKANQPWTASSSHSWVTVVPGEGMDGDSYTGSGEERTISFKISVEANPGTSTRYAEVTISSPTSAFTPQRLNVTQEGSTDTFFITPTEVPQVTWRGDTIDISVYSPREPWTVTVGNGEDWINIDRTSGEASTQPVTIQVVVKENMTSSPRFGSILIARVGSDGTVIAINQSASAEAPDPDDSPKVSMPWIGSGWTATYARIYAYFTGTNYKIDKVGVVYQNVDDPDDYHDVSGVIAGDNMIYAELTDLKPDTTYKVWAYVDYEHNGMSMGSSGSVLTFTTPSLNGDPGSGIPGDGDNTPPSPN